MPVTNFNLQITDPLLDDGIFFNGTQFVNKPSYGQANSAFGAIVQYVETFGNDSNSGYDRSRPKKTVKAAINALQGTSHTGTIYVGCGLFEEDPMILKTRLRIIGGGPEIGNGSSGTTIKLKSGSNAVLFSPPAPPLPDITWMHYTHLEKLTLDGNRDGQTGDYDILQIEGGGFNCMLRDLHFQNAGRWAILIDRAAVNVQTSNLSGSYCGRLPVGAEVYDPTIRGGFLFFNKTSGGANDNILMIGSQLDVCGRYPIFVNHKTNLGGNLIIIGLKLETGGASNFENNWSAIGYDGTNIANNRLNIHVIGSRVDNFGNVGNKGFIHQVAGTTEVNIILQQIGQSGSLVLYRNDPLSYTFSARSSVEGLPIYSNIGRGIFKDLNSRCPTYATDAAAGFGGLIEGDFYKTATGELRVKL